MENLRKMLLAMPRYPCHHLQMADADNMRTMEYQTRKSSRKALETMEIYAPIAHGSACRDYMGTKLNPFYYLDLIGYAEIGKASPDHEHNGHLSTVFKKDIGASS
jgi:GTP pyrophosphokinase